jgi:pimeloyl-ACP methyl ester carboxylesterase
VLIVIAGEDEIISRARSEALAIAFTTPGQVQVEVVPGVGHNTLDGSPAYLGAVRRFLASNGGASASTSSNRARLRL